MREIITKAYTYEELNDEAKEKARDWYREIGLDTNAWEYVLDDAKNIGLKIISLDPHRANKGNFLASAEECAHKIEKEHGPDCETYKTAKKYLAVRDEIVNTAEKDENGDFLDQWELDKELDNADADFLQELLEDYRIIYEKSVEESYSNESVEEMIIANEYEFTEEGKRL